MPVLKQSSSKAEPDKAIDYILNPKKAALVDVLNLDNIPGTFADQMRSTAEFWGKDRSYDSRKYYHFKFSPDPKDHVSAEACHAAALEFARTVLNDYECIVSTHTDTDVVHSHIVINAVSFETGRKFHNNNKEYGELKDLANDIGEKYGMTPLDWRALVEEKRTAYLTGDFTCAESVTEKRIKLRGGISWKEELREVIDLAKASTDNIIAFEEFLEEYGVTLPRFTDKTISYKHPCRKKPVRGGLLGDAYTLKAIEDHFIKMEFEEYESHESTLTPKAIEAMKKANVPILARSETISYFDTLTSLQVGMTATERRELYTEITRCEQMKLVIANARISSDGFTEFAVYLSEYGIEVRFNADGELEYKHPLQTVWSTEANIGREYYKDVIGKSQNGLNSGASERGAVGRTAPTDDEKGAGQRRANDAPQSEQAVSASNAGTNEALPRERRGYEAGIDGNEGRNRTLSDGYEGRTNEDAVHELGGAEAATPKLHGNVDSNDRTARDGKHSVSNRDESGDRRTHNRS